MSHLNILTNSEELPKLLPNLVYFTRSKYENDWFSEKHMHHFTEIFYILDGEGAFHVADNVCAVQKNDLYIIDPYIEHFETSSSEHPLEYIVLGIENVKFEVPVLEKSLYEQESSNTSDFHYFHQFQKYERVIEFFNNIMLELNKIDDDSKIAANAYLSLFLIFIKRNTKLTILHDEYKNYSKEISVVKKYIDSYYNEEITIDILAKKVFLSKYYLLHKFKQQLKMSPIAYLQTVRINAAKNSLINTNLSISDVSKISGFNNPTYFSSTFKSIVKMSPMAYRNKYQSDFKK